MRCNTWIGSQTPTADAKRVVAESASTQIKNGSGVASQNVCMDSRLEGHAWVKKNEVDLSKVWLRMPLEDV